MLYCGRRNFNYYIITLIYIKLILSDKSGKKLLLLRKLIKDLTKEKFHIGNRQLFDSEMNLITTRPLKPLTNSNRKKGIHFTNYPSLLLGL